MKLKGWTRNDLDWAVAYANAKYEAKGGAMCCLKEVDTYGVKECQYRVTLRHLPGTSKRKKRTDPIPAGVPYRTYWKKFQAKRPLGIPMSELFGKGLLLETREEERQRVTHACCWHMFGHFMRGLFRLNREGKIYTSVARYLGEDHFDRTVSYHDKRIQVECTCYEHGLGSF